MTATLTPPPAVSPASRRATPDPVRGIRPAAGARLVQPALCAVAAALTAWPYAGYFGGDAGLLLPAVVSAAAGSAVAAAVARQRSWVVLVAWALGLVVTAGLLVRPDEFGGTSWAAFAATAGNIRHAWGRMLAVNLPADPLPELLVLPVLVTWTAAFTAVLVARRTRAPLAPTVPPVLALVVTLLISAARHVPQPLAAIALVAVLVLLVRVRVHVSEAGLVQAAPGPRRGDTGRRAAALGLLAVTLAVALAAAAAVQRVGAPRDRFDVRTLSPPPVRITRSVTPLKLVKPQLVEPVQPLFSVRASGPARIDRVRIATLDRYDGTVWSSGAQYRVAGRVLRTVMPPPEGSRVSLHVVLNGLAGPFLPVAGDPDGLTGDDVSGKRTGFDPRVDTVVRAGPLQPGLTYDVTGMYSGVDDLGDTDAPMVTPENAALAEAPGDVPVVLRTLELQLTAGAASPREQLLRFQTYLRRQPYSLAAPPGHSYQALTALLAGGPAAAGHAEQHAAAFALLARIAGYPARVAVGYRVPPGATGPVTVTTHQAHAWPEVWFPRHGWVVFEPTDPTLTAAVRPPGAGEPDAGPASSAAADDPDRQSHGDESSERQPLPVLLLLGGILLAILLLLVSIPAAKRAQRWSRRRGHAGRRLLGAEATAHDLLTERAFAANPPLAVTPSDTSLDVAVRAEASFGQAVRPLRELAAGANAVRFGALPADPAVADRAWSIVRQFRRDLDTGVAGRARRLRAELDPRPLWRRSRLAARTVRAVRRRRAETAS